jgi:predicted RNA-binding Zn ribbon-like protein
MGLAPTTWRGDDENKPAPEPLFRLQALNESWGRLTACRNDDCLWAFYDGSRNHGGTWCDMAACGNRLKNRDLRARRRQIGH